jgi:putative glutamine amidotransferase
VAVRRQPRIGITKPKGRDHGSYSLIALGVRLSGATPVALTPGDAISPQSVDGLILGGGGDIFPMLYDDVPKQGYLYDRERDALEIGLAKRASDEDIPVMGVCRGAQLLNVMRGGSLHLDASKAYEDAHYPDSFLAKIFFRKPIAAIAGSIIQRALGSEKAFVNSLHKQSIKRVGEGLEVTAREPNGIVQAVEDPRKRFFVGVQFHPEFMLHRRKFRRVFKLLSEAAKNSSHQLKITDELCRATHN